MNNNIVIEYYPVFRHVAFDRNLRAPDSFTSAESCEAE